MNGFRRVASGAICTLALLGAATAPATAERYVAGSPGLGDELFPFAGNGGYDVQRYDLRLDYDPDKVRLEGVARIHAVATQDLDQFNIDFRDFYAISKLEVNGHPARFWREGEHELVIRPRPKLKAGRAFTLEVQYAGTPEPVVDPDGSIEGWIPTDDGAFVVNEPQGSPGWYPANDNPQDRASFSFAITVPEGHTALGNGVLVGVDTAGGKTTWRWLQRDPIPPYLATATNGVFNYTQTTLSSGLPFYRAIDPRRTGSNMTASFADQVITYFSQVYGPYPFEAAGGIVDFAPDVGYALETATKANYATNPSASTVVHELSHEWFGNAVTPARWKDIWLNEGFARFSEWLWTEHTGGRTAQASFELAYSRVATDTAYWSPAPGNPTAETMFDGTIYTRGGMTLQALRAKIGDPAFFTLLKRWYTENRGQSVTTEEFIALAEQVSGQQLDTFFNVWLYQDAKPAPGSW